MPASRELQLAFRESRFLRLYGTRLAGQTADGIFQVGLAGFVLFNPERQASAAEVAGALAVVLIPFSLIGPFAGVLIDRWHRQRLLLWTNLLRALALLGVAGLVAAGVTGPALYAAALVVFSLNRFVLSTLSASLPHVVPPRVLVAANALSISSGTVAALVGASLGYLVRHLAGVSNDGSAAVMEAAAAVYLLATVLAATLPVAALGPDGQPAGRLAPRTAARQVAAGLVDAGRHLRRRPPAMHALGLMSAQRLAYGFATVTTILLCRNYFAASADVNSGLRALATVVGATGVGVLVGAVLTPLATRRLGIRGWALVALLVSAVAQVAFTLPYTLVVLAVGGAVLGACAQSIKICVDTLVQRSVLDVFRGRVFAVYDVLFNIAYVLAAVLAALVLPADGRSPWSVVAIGAVYLATAAWWLRATRGDRGVRPDEPLTPTTPAATPTTSAELPTPLPH